MSAPYYADESVTLWHGDCIEVLARLADASVDAIVTDPPYGLGFMGKEWDSGKSFVERKAATRNTFDHVGGNHNPTSSADAARTRRAESVKFGAWCSVWAEECLRVLKPGGHLLAFGGSRTWHRLAVAVEDAGFEVRDSIAWLYGSGFPKSLDVSKAIDKMRTEDRAPVDAVRSWLNARRLEAGYSHDAVNKHFGHASNGGGSSSAWMTNPTSRNLPTWDQWLALKELFGFSGEMDSEVWRLNGRKGKPGDNWDAREVVGKSVRSTAGFSAEMVPRPWKEMVGEDYDITAPATPAAQQWQGWGTALKPAFEPIVVGRKPLAGTVAANVLEHGTGALNIAACRITASGQSLVRPAVKRDDNDVLGKGLGAGVQTEPTGRWPANVVLDDTQAAELDRQSGTTVSRVGKPRGAASGDGWGMTATGAEYDDAGGASRFFPTFRYEAKAPALERPRHGEVAHPTVKPLDLMRWLVRLVTPPGGTVLEPFAGSGTTAEACVLEGFQCIAIEREADYLPLITARLTKPLQPSLDLGGAA